VCPQLDDCHAYRPPRSRPRVTSHAACITRRGGAKSRLRLRGHYGYYGRRGNRAKVWMLLYLVKREWRKWLSRRSQRGLSWDTMNRLLQHYPLPVPSVVVPA
jgi:hypothetical protein